MDLEVAIKKIQAGADALTQIWNIINFMRLKTGYFGRYGHFESERYKKIILLISEKKP
jgi:hypothetical protein